MTPSKLEIFVGKFSVYIIGFFALLSALTTAGWYASNLKLDAERSHSEKVETQLSVSNSSYNSIKDAFSKLSGELQDNQKKALENQAVLNERLQNIVASDKSRLALEAHLLARPSTTNCEVPKELIDAWSKM